MTKFQPISHNILARGIDATNTFNKIAPGFSTDLVNVDCADQGSLKKRKGYEGFLGDVPLRLSSIDVNPGNTATLALDQEVNLLLTPSTPIELYGDPLRTGTGTLTSVGASVTGSGTLFTSTLVQGSILRAGGEERRVESISSDTALTLDEPFYGDLSAEAFTYRTIEQFYFPAFVNESKYSVDPGVSDVEITFGHSTGNIVAPIMLARSDSTTVLDNTTIYPDDLIYYDNGLDVDINMDTSGLVDDTEFYITSEDDDFTTSLATYDADVTISTVGAATINISAGTHNLPNLNVIPFMGYQDPNDLTKYINFVPDEFIIESDGDIRIEVTVAEDMRIAGDCNIKLRLFDMGGSYAQESSFTAGDDSQIAFPGVMTPFNFTSFYILDPSTSEQLQVYPETVSYDTTLEQLEFTFSLDISGTLRAVYMPGIVRSNRITVDITDHSDMLDDSLPQTVMWGIPNADVVYRDSVERGGELSGLEEYSSASGNYLVATGSGLLYKETTGELSLAEVNVDIRRRVDTSRVVGPFFSNDAAQTRKCEASNITDGTLPITSITNNGDGTADVLLNITDKVGDLTDLVVGNDVFTISGTEVPEYTGAWSITVIDDITNTLTLTITDLKTYTKSESDTGAVGGVFSDVVSMSPTDDEGDTLPLPFLVDDVLNSTLFSVAMPTVLEVDGTSLWLDGINEVASLPSGARLSADRTSNIIQVDNIVGLVRGDIISISGYTRHPRIQELDVDASTVTIDESLLVSDNAVSRTQIAVEGRWIPVESPAYNQRKFIYWDADETTAQSKIVSARINDSIFFSNYIDPVLKYDGDAIYRAGIPGWQMQSHSWVDSTETGIVLPKLNYLSIDNNDPLKAQMYFSELPDLTGVTTFYSVETSTEYDIISVNETDRYIVFNNNATPLTLTGGEVNLPQEVGYYFKVQAIDSNNNVIASAVTDYEESIVRIVKDGAITHRLTGLAKFDIYDYDRLDVYIFRTKIGLAALPPFYQVRRDPLNYKYTEGEDVLVLNDTTPDEALSPIPDDQASIALKGAELPLSSEEPPRSKYMTSSDNRLILGNIKSWNTLDLDLLSNSGITEYNVMDDMTIALDDVDNNVTVDCIPFMNWTGTQYDVLNSTDVSEITDITYVDDTTVRLTLSGSIGSSLVGDYIQLGSWFTDANATGVYASTGRTRDDALGGLIGWWQVNAHTVTTNDTIDLFYIHGRATDTSDDWTMSGTEAPLYFAHSTGNLPVVQVPYVLGGATGRYVEDVVFDDRKNQFEFTSAINRGLKDIRTALVQYMTRQTEPWLLVKAGATEGSGKIIFRAVRPEKTITGTTTVDASSDLQLFWNQRRTPSGDSASGVEQVFPSRLVISTANYPEMFDNPFAVSGLYGDSIIDVSANDGQEITGMSTFFSNSTTAASNLEETLVVFKNKSVYAVNLATRSSQKLDSGSQGCTIPGSIAVTKDGIMFANTSGVYMVTKNLDIIHVGTWIENKWTDEVNFDAVADRATAITDGLNRRYKLSIPLDTDTRNDHVAVFNYESAGELGGGWTFYDNFPASDWVQTNEGTYFSSYGGRIFRLRDTGEVTDYRDDDQAIETTIVYGPQSFNNTGNRAVLNRVIAHIEGKVTNLQPLLAVDLESTWYTLDSITVDGTKVGDTVASSIPSRHATFFQMQYQHSTKDEEFTLGGLDFLVSGLPETGIKQAKDT